MIEQFEIQCHKRKHWWTTFEKWHMDRRSWPFGQKSNNKKERKGERGRGEGGERGRERGGENIFINFIIHTKFFTI